MNNFFVIVFSILIHLPDGTEEPALIQYGGAPQFHDTIEQCDAYLKYLGPDELINTFLSNTFRGVDRLEITDDPHCTMFNIQTQKYKDYPQFDLEPGDLPQYQGTKFNNYIINIGAPHGTST